MLELAPRGGPTKGGHAYYVSTPIGNLEDITLRAVRTLREVDVVACEDTRVSAALLRYLNITNKKLVSHHDHNLESSVPKLVEMLRDGQSVAVVSDAGTPGISDPGLALAAACARSNLPTVPIPGPCAAVAALSVAGLDASEFVFAGFIPRSNKPRSTKAAELASEPRAIVLYEAPHRLVDTLGVLCAEGAGGRGVLVARELTKLHEEYFRGTLSAAYSHFGAVAERDGKLRGEFTLVVAPLDAETRNEQTKETALATEALALAEVAARLAAGGSLNRIAKEVAAEFGVARARCYNEGLRLKAEAKQERQRQRAAAARSEEEGGDL